MSLERIRVELARFFRASLQRGEDGSIEALMHDINLVATAAASGPLAPVGGWRGRVMRLTGGNGLSANVLSIRTWLES